MRYDFSAKVSSHATLVGSAIAALVVALGGHAVSAEAERDRAGCACPDTPKNARSNFAGLPGPALTESDEIAALESVQMGLTRMHDGEPFVWRHANGKLSGIVRPTASFRNAEGRLCRHVIVLLTTGYKTSTTEGIACRLPDRRWALEG